MRKVANMLLVIYVVFCVFLNLLGCALNGLGIPSFEDIALDFVTSLTPGLFIYAMIHLLYDTYKQFALWKIISIVLLIMFFYIICYLYFRQFDKGIISFDQNQPTQTRSNNEQ